VFKPKTGNHGTEQRASESHRRPSRCQFAANLADLALIAGVERVGFPSRRLPRGSRWG
jgi:hypothetical protein